MQNDSQRGSCPQTRQRVKLSRQVQFIVALSICFSFGEVAWAQKDEASIVGTVEDPSGAVVPGVQVTATDVDRGTSFMTSTGISGNYVAGPLKIGRYRVKVSKKDFKTVIIAPFELQVGQRKEVNVKLEIGEVMQSVNINAVPALETQTSDLGQVVDSSTIIDLPLNGRNFSQLALLSAGIAPAEPGAANEGSFGFSSNGARSYQNNYMFDGIDNNSNITDLQKD